MILADKIIRLRKKAGWSQEELADKMDVSRQSVSKWESAKSIPDLNKILMLSKIFEVSTDYLVKDEIEEVGEEVPYDDFEIAVKKVSLDEASEYLDSKINVSKFISKGVVLCIFSFLPLMLLLAMSQGSYYGINNNIATSLGLVILFLMVSLGVTFFIRINQYSSVFEKFETTAFELEYGVKGIFNEKLINYKPEYLKRLTISVILFITSCLPLLTVSIMIPSGALSLLMVVVLILMIGLGLYIIIPTSIIYGTLTLIISEGESTPERLKETKKIEKIAAVYWPLITAIFIGWSLWTMNWGRTWIIWPVAAIAFAVIVGLVQLLSSTNDV